MQIDETAFAALHAETHELKQLVAELKEEIGRMSGQVSEKPGEFGLIPINEVSQAGGPHAQSLRRMIQAGTIPGIRIGRKYYIRKSDLEKMLTPKNAHQ